MKPSHQYPNFSQLRSTKLVALFLMCTLTMLVSAKCSQQDEVSPDTLLKVTLKQGESYQVKANDAVYTITHNSVKIKFAENVDGYVYMRGDINLTVNSNPVQITAVGNYNSKGERKSDNLTHLKETLGTADVGSITIGIANFYPLTSDASADHEFAIDLLIQQK